MPSDLFHLVLIFKLFLLDNNHIKCGHSVYTNVAFKDKFF